MLAGDEGSPTPFNVDRRGIQVLHWRSRLVLVQSWAEQWQSIRHCAATVRVHPVAAAAAARPMTTAAVADSAAAVRRVTR